MKVYYAYHNGVKINSVAMSKDDVEKLKTHTVVKYLDAGRLVDIPVKELRIVERIVF